MQRNLSKLAAAIGAALLMLPAIASEGRMPVFEPGTVIAADGAYVVTRNLAATSGPVITISASNVLLDLNGLTLTGNNASALIQVGGGFLQHITIRNGTLAYGAIGIEAPGVTEHLTIEDVKINNTISGAGIHLGNVEAAVIRRVEIRNAAAEGILWDGTQTKIGVIEDCVINIATRGIFVYHSCLSVSVRDNRVEAGGHGIELNQCRASTVTGNVVSLASGSGIRLVESWGNVISGNAVSQVFGNGLHVDANSSSNLIQNNTFTRNGGFNDYGVRIDGSWNKLEGNVINENAAGLLFSATACGNTFGRNSARGNQSFQGACSGSPPLFPPQSCNMASSCGVPNTSMGDNMIPGPPAF